MYYIRSQPSGDLEMSTNPFPDRKNRRQGSTTVVDADTTRLEGVYANFTKFDHRRPHLARTNF